MLLKMKLMGSALAIVLAAATGIHVDGSTEPAPSIVAQAQPVESVLSSYTQAICEKGCDLANVVAVNQH
jgi:hypothetical protein